VVLNSSFLFRSFVEQRGEKILEDERLPRNSGLEPRSAFEQGFFF
jgi:hypothetical protein